MNFLASAALQGADALLDAAVEADRIIAMATAMKYDLLEAASAAYLDGRSGSEPFESFRAEVAAALRIPERTASIVIDEGFALSTRLPATLAALREGVISPRHARILISETACIDDDARADIERRALRESHRSTGDFARLLRRWTSPLREPRTVTRTGCIRSTEADVTWLSVTVGLVDLPHPQSGSLQSTK